MLLCKNRRLFTVAGDNSHVLTPIPIHLIPISIPFPSHGWSYTHSHGNPMGLMGSQSSPFPCTPLIPMKIPNRNTDMPKWEWEWEEYTWQWEWELLLFHTCQNSHRSTHTGELRCTIWPVRCHPWATRSYSLARHVPDLVAETKNDVKSLLASWDFEAKTVECLHFQHLSSFDYSVINVVH